MARIRSIHPGLLTDEAFMTLTVEQPLAIPLYLGLLMEADDYGIFEWKPMTLKARVLPAAPADVSMLLQVLVEQRFIVCFEVDGRKLGAVRNFCRYQRPKKPSAVHPRTPEVENWIALKERTSPTGSEPVPHQSGTGGENPPQMEDGGWRMKGKEEGEPPPSLRSGSPSATDADGTRADQPRSKKRQLDDGELVDKIGSLWNVEARALGLPTINGFSDRRLAALRARIREMPTHGFEDPFVGFQAAMAKIRGSPFLLGQGQRGWKADFDYLVSAQGLTKILEGSYAQAR